MVFGVGDSSGLLWMLGSSTPTHHQTGTPPSKNAIGSTKWRKKRTYAQRVREIEHSSFTPIVLSASGGFAREATNFYKRLASRLADKWDQPYSLTMSWLRCTISFALLRSAIQWIRGARSSGGHPVLPVDLVIAEAHLN